MFVCLFTFLDPILHIYNIRSNLIQFCLIDIPLIKNYFLYICIDDIMLNMTSDDLNCDLIKFMKIFAFCLFDQFFLLLRLRELAAEG